MSTVAVLGISRYLFVAALLAGLFYLCASYHPIPHFSSDVPSQISPTPRPVLLAHSPQHPNAHDGPVTYLPFTYGRAALLQSLEGYEHAGWRNIVILDNSRDHTIWSDRAEILKAFKVVVDIITTPVHLHFSQIQVYMDYLANSAGADVYLWAHTDVLLLSNGTSPYTAMLECLDWARAQNLGTVFLDYDRLNAVFTGPSAHAPWDEEMPQYGSDCDRYHRLRLAGYGVEECPIQVGKVVHMHVVASAKQREELWSMDNLEDQLSLLEKVNYRMGQYQWREMSDRDRAAMSASEKGGKEYERQKWGVEIDWRNCDHLDQYTTRW